MTLANGNEDCSQGKQSLTRLEVTTEGSDRGAERGGGVLQECGRCLLRAEPAASRHYTAASGPAGLSIVPVVPWEGAPVASPPPPISCQIFTTQF